MRSWFSLSGVSTLLVLAAACSQPVASGPGETRREPKPGADQPDDTDEPPGSTGPTDKPASTGPLGVVTIDTQQVFFDTAGRRNPKLDVAGLMARSKRVFELAAAKNVPLFITYEAAKTSDHALPPTLAAALPAKAQEFIKTTFAATGQPQFLPAIKTSGVRRLVVIGAETDVCVMQSVLGMRRAGYEVIAAVDALFSEEVNTAPARRRLRQAGVVELGMKDVETLLETGGSSPAPSTSAPPVIVRPLEIGFLLHDLGGLGAADANASAKTVRLRELLLISEWFKIPLLAADPASALAALPANLRTIITRPITSLAARPAQIKQLAIAGGHAGIASAASDLAGKADVFLVEDALIGGAAGDLEPLYVQGAVPTTYKALYYELIQSVSEAQWPSPQWVTDGAKYFDLTKAPEELPPIATP